MSIDNIVSLVLTISPAVVATIMSISGIAITIKKFADIISIFKQFAFNNKEEIDRLKRQYEIVLQENHKLKRQLNELLTKLDHIKRS